MKDRLFKMFRIITVLSVCILFGVTLNFSTAKMETFGEFTYQTNWGEAEITGYTGKSDTVVIPSEIDGYEVTEIGESAFAKNQIIKNVVLPNTITEINKEAFIQCPKLETINFPEKLYSINEVAFYECTALKRAIFPKSLKSIGKMSFYGCKTMNKLSLPDGLEEIDEYAFYKCSKLKTLVIPDSVVRMKTSAFRKCKSLKSVKISNKLEYIEEYEFDGCTSLTSVVIPKSVIVIEYAAFCDCSKLKKVTLSKGLEAIYGYAFYGCDVLLSLSIPTTVTILAKSAVPVNNKAFKMYVYSRRCRYTSDPYGGNDFTEGTMFGYADSTTEYYAANICKNYIRINLEAKPTKLVRMKKKGRSLRIKLKKVSHCAGYKVQYATNKSMKKAKSLFSRTNKLTIPLAKKVYYVRFCTYSKGTIFNVKGNWTKVIKISK